MTQGLPPKPTCLSIVAGIVLAVLILAAFAFLPNMVKWVGAVFTFLPGRLALIQVVQPSEVIPVDMSSSPTLVVFGHAGHYALFTANLDLLSINEAVLAAKAKPWFRLRDSLGNEVPISLYERGLALYDTPLAAGRPVARFEITRAGSYTMTHPSRPDRVFVVPDYTTGQESAIMFYMLVQAAALGVGVWYVRKRTRKPLTRIIVPPPSRRSRERFEAEQAVAELALPKIGRHPWKADAFPALQQPEVSPIAPVRDVLGMVQEKQLGPTAAEGELEDSMLTQSGSAGTKWGAPLGLSPSEVTAYTQGGGIDDLLKLRYEGWPTTCAQCGQPIDHQELRWWLVRDQAGAPRLRHFECPPKPT